MLRLLDIDMVQTLAIHLNQAVECTGPRLSAVSVSNMILPAETLNIEQQVSPEIRCRFFCSVAICMLKRKYNGPCQATWTRPMTMVVQDMRDPAEQTSQRASRQASRLQAQRHLQGEPHGAFQGDSPRSSNHILSMIPTQSNQIHLPCDSYDIGHYCFKSGGLLSSFVAIASAAAGMRCSPVVLRTHYRRSPCMMGMGDNVRNL